MTTEDYVKQAQEGTDAEDVGLFIWHPDFEKEDKSKLLRRIHTIADKLFGFYRGRNKVSEDSGQGSGDNPMSNYDLYQGKVNEKNFKNLVEPWGDKGNAPLKDYSFFKTPIARLVGKYQALPFRFSVEKVGQQAAIEQLDREVEIAVERSMRKMAQMMAEDGMDLQDQMVDPSIYVPETEEEVLKGTELVEQAVFDLVDYIIYRYRLHHQLSECLRDKTIVNEEFMEVIEGRENPIPQRRDPRQVCYVGEVVNNSIESCDAVGVVDMATLSKVVEEYGHLLRESGKYDAFLNELRKIYKQDVNYPHYTDGTMEELVDGGSFDLRADYFMRGSSFWDSRIAVQRFYVKMVKWRKNRVTLDGRPLTKEEVKLKKEGLLERIDDLLYEPVDDDYEAKGDETIHEISYIDLYQGVRLGGRYLVRWGRVPNQVRAEDNPRCPEFPLKGFVSRERSLITVGESLNEVYISCYYAIRKLINNMGAKVINYDLTQMPEGYEPEDVLFEMKEVNINFYNSQQVKGAPNIESSKHLTVSDLSMGDDVIRLVNLAMLMRRTYSEMIGLPMQAQGIVQPREGVGQTKDMIDMGELMMQPLFFEHSEFVHQVLQQIGERGRFVWAKDEMRRYVLGERGVKTIRLTKDIELYRYGFYLTEFYKDKEDKEFIQQLVLQSIPAGAASLREAISVYNAKNPKTAEAIFDQGMSTMEKLQAQAQEQGGMAEQAKAQSEQMKAQVPLQVSQMNNDAKMAMQQEQLAFEREKLNTNDATKRDMTDTKIEADTIYKQ